MNRKQLDAHIDEIMGRPTEDERTKSLHVALAIAEHGRTQAEAQRDELLAACEAEEAIEDHMRICPTCQVDRHQCGARTDLFLEARRLREVAIAKANASPTD